MSVILPTSPAPNGAEPYFLDAGGVQRSLAGGEDMRLDRLGDRWGLAVTLIPMRWEGLVGTRTDAARVWVARLIQGLSQGAILPFPQPGFTPPGNTASSVATAAVSGASTFRLKHTGAAVTLREGQMLTHLRAATGRRYLYQVRADTVVPANGQADVPIWPRIRGPFAVNDAIELKKPVIDGLVRGDRVAWALAVSKLSAIQFTIEEGA